MKCPKCGKLLSQHIDTLEQDGGLVVTFTCSKCESQCDAFISPFDLEEHYAEVEEFYDV